MAEVERRIERLYVATFGVAIVHEIDSAYWHEWSVFGLPGGIQLFLALHMVLIPVFLFGLVRIARGAAGGASFAIVLSGAGISGFVVHSALLLRGGAEFRNAASLATLGLLFATSLPLLLASLRWVVGERRRGCAPDATVAARHGAEPGREEHVRDVVESIEREYRRYKKLAEGAFDQLSDAELAHTTGSEGNSVAIIVWHISGNLTSRFTEFLAADGEKPWRRRDAEFDNRRVDQAALRLKWQDGWAVLFATLATLSDSDLGRVVSIRNELLPVRDALHRSLAHTSYHVGQIVLLGKSVRGSAWRTLTIPRAKA
jgi:hypothetical protein